MLDPRQTFIVLEVNRNALALALNSALGGETFSQEFKNGDPRLTDEICQEYADLLRDAYQSIPVGPGTVFEAIRLGMLEKLGLTPGKHPL